jgi:hypothetical protein
LIRVRVTKLVYQIGLTTFFRSQGRENILAAAASSSKQQAASSSKQQAAASKQLSSFLPIRISPSA